MKSMLAHLGLACACAGLARAQFNPVPLTPGSFTQDIVVEKGAPCLANFTTATIDNGTNNNGNTFFEQGYIPNIPALGLPPHGTTFASHADGNHVFQMPPSYVTNNAAYVGANNAPGTGTLQTQVPTASLTVTDPGTAYTGISILWGSGGGGAVNVTVSYADGSTEPFSFTSIDWFDGSTAYAWIAGGRVQNSGAATFQNLFTTTATKLFNSDFTLTHTGSAITNVSFTYAGSTSYRVFVFGISATTDGTHFNPVASVSGFNADVVVEVGAPCGVVQGYNVSMDGGPNMNGDTYYEQGFCTVHGGSSPLNVGNSQGGTGTTGLPHPGAMVTVGNYTMQMPASYAGNDCVFIGNYPAGAVTNGSFSSPSYLAGNMTITSPQIYNALSIMGAAGGGTVLNYTLYYSDLTSSSGTLSIIDWFNTSSAGMFTAMGRVNGTSPSIDNLGSTSGIRLYHHDITGLSASAAVTNIALSWASGGKAALFALSAQSTGGGAFTPIAFTGFDADAIVEKEQPFYPAGTFPYTTATMDQGTNNSAFTWFEKGWVTNGQAVASGLPPAGSNIVSSNAPNRIYQMPPTYSGPNSVLIDINHQFATITPMVPTAGTAFALLTAGGSIGSGHVMTNLCILEHADGVNETNTFFGYDWFENTVSPAFCSNGRIQSHWGDVESVWNNSPGSLQYPKLFETIFPTIDTGSPVTNIVVQYKLAGGTSWTTYVLSVSASSAPVAPVVGPTIIPSNTYDGSNFMAQATESGTLPFTNQWQFSADGTNWANLQNGVGNFLNVSNVANAWGTALFSNTNASIANIGQYRLVVSGPAGAVTNGAATLNVVSPLPDVVLAADTNNMALFLPGGAEPTAEPAGETFIHAIDDFVGGDPGKWLNFGYNGGQPWTPTAAVGFTVTPSLGKTTVSILRYYMANDAPERNPGDFTLEGSNDGGNTWTTIAQGLLNLPTARNGGNSTAVNPLTQVVSETRFANSTGYLMYRWSCTNVANNAAANSMQIGEIEFLGFQTPTAPIITSQSGPSIMTYVGSSPTFFVTASGFPTNLAYQWYRDSGGGPGVIAGATSSSYTLANAQMSDSGAIFSCVVTNTTGSTPSANSTLTVVAAPTTAYATNVLHDGPIAYLRLGEGPDDGTGGGNNGVVAFDTWGGHNGYYTNAILEPNLPAAFADPSNGDAYFGKSAGGYISTAGPVDSCVEAIGGIDFAKTNASAALSVEAWVMLDPTFTAGGPIPGAGIVAKGYGGGGEQFNLDCGGGGNAFRFFVRDTSGNTHAPTSAVVPDPGVWHHLVGVVDEANSNVVLYVDGLQAGASAVNPTNGILSSTYPVTIGARAQNPSTNNNLTFYGTVDEVAIYNKALSSSQVMNHFLAAGIAPRFILAQTQNPTNITVSEGATTNLYEPFYGSPTLAAQWSLSTDGGGTFTPLGGETSSTLTLANVPASANGYEYQLTVTNSYGTTNSVVFLLAVISGPPVLQADVTPSSALVYAGRAFSLQTLFGGSPPISYQWYHNGSPLSNGSRVSGALSNVLTIVNAQTNDLGSYYVTASNAYSGGNPTPSSTATVLVETIPDFNNTGIGWTVQQNASGGTRNIAGDVLTLTDGTGSEATAAFYTYPLNITAFQAGFTYQDVGGGGADGAAFVVQNDARGAAALGGGGGALGLSGITPSLALTLNIYSGSPGGSGMSFGLDGANGNPYTTTYPLAVDGGDPIGVSVLYQGGLLSVVLTDAVVHTTFTTNVLVDLPGIVGANTAYVGFTGGDGGVASTQTITNFFFIPQPTLAAQHTSTNTIVLSWPATIGGYALLQNSALPAGAWAASPATVNAVGSQYQAVVTPSGGAQFYRLVLQPIEP